MAVLDPLDQKTKEMVKEHRFIDDRVKMTLEGLDSNKGAKVTESGDYAFYWRIWKDEFLENGIQMAEFNRSERNFDENSLRNFRNELDRFKSANALVNEWVNKNDIEVDYGQPIESWKELDQLQDDLNSLPRITYEKFGIPWEERRYFDLIRDFSSHTDSFEAFPIVEGVLESLHNIEEEKHNLMELSLKEYNSKGYDKTDQAYSRTRIPDKPMRWKEIIDEKGENLKEYLDFDGIATATPGRILEVMMEDIVEDIPGVKSEFPLAWARIGNGDEVSKEEYKNGTLTPQPDAVEDLFVHEFKHMPSFQKEELEESGSLKLNDILMKNIKQVNSYLHHMNLRYGVLAHISTDMDVKEHIIEIHPIYHTEKYVEEFRENDFWENYVHDREEQSLEEIW